MLNIDEIRGEFPQLKQKRSGFPLAYFDSAATTLKPEPVIRAITQFYSYENSNVHRGGYFLSQQATALFEESRKVVADFLNADEKEIVFTSGTTDGINLLAQSMGSGYFSAGDQIILTHMEHHSNIVPWQIVAEREGLELLYLPITKEGELQLSQLEQLLTNRCKLISLTHVSNAIGTINDVKTVAEAAHKRGIPVIVDGAQAVSHFPVDVKELSCDFYLFSGHKVMGPTGVGVLFGKREWLEKLSPPRGGGGMLFNISDKKSLYQEIPYKWEAGTPPIAQAIGLAEAIRWLQQFDFLEINRYEEAILQYLLKELAALPAISLTAAPSQRAPIVSFFTKGVHPHDLVTLMDEKNIAFRAGHHCALPLFKSIKGSQGQFPPPSSRISCSFLNKEEEVVRLVASLKEAERFFHD